MGWVADEWIYSQNWTEIKQTESKIVKTKLTVCDEKMIEKMQKKLILDKNQRIPILKPYYWSNTDSDLLVGNDFKIVFSSFFKSFRDSFQTNNDYGQCLDKDRYNWTSLFTIKYVYAQDDFYVFEDTSWCYFHVLIEEFEKNWMVSPSFKAWKPDVSVSWFVIDNSSSTINLIKNNKIVSTVVGDLIVVVDKDVWDVIVVNENNIEYIKIDALWNQNTPNPIAHSYGSIVQMKIDNNANFLLFISQ